MIFYFCAFSESLFRNVVSGSKRDDGHGSGSGSSHNTPRGGAHQQGQVVITGGAQSQKGPYSLPHAGNEAETRRPSTSGEILTAFIYVFVLSLVYYSKLSLGHLQF